MRLRELEGRGDERPLVTPDRPGWPITCGRANATPGKDSHACLNPSSRRTRARLRTHFPMPRYLRDDLRIFHEVT